MDPNQLAVAAEPAHERQQHQQQNRVQRLGEDEDPDQLVAVLGA
jgi:hypothetical protein